MIAYVLPARFSIALSWANLPVPWTRLAGLLSKTDEPFSLAARPRSRNLNFPSRACCLTVFQNILRVQGTFYTISSGTSSIKALRFWSTRSRLLAEYHIFLATIRPARCPTEFTIPYTINLILYIRYTGEFQPEVSCVLLSLWFMP